MTTAGIPEETATDPAESSSSSSSSSTPPRTPTEPPSDPAEPAVERRSGVAPVHDNIAPPPPSVLHPRGRIWPLLPSSKPLWRQFVRGVVRLIQGLYHHEDIFQMAPAMAFHFFLSLLPLLVFIGYLLGLVAQHKGASAVLTMMLDNLPATTEVILKKEVGGLSQATSLGPIAAIGFFWIASGGTQGLMQAIERVVGVPPRAWWRQRLLALGWVVGLIVAFAIVSFSIIQWDEVVHAPDDAVAVAVATNPTTASAPGPAKAPSADPNEGVAPAPQATPATPAAKRARKFLRDGGERVLTIILSLVAAVGGLAAFYHFAVAHSRRVRRRVLPGAFLGIALVIIISWGFGLYIRTLAQYTIYYGSLAAIAVLLVWLWLMSIAILVGAELNSQLEGLRDLPRATETHDELRD